MNDKTGLKLNGECYLFIGTTPNIGTTLTSLTFAHRLAQSTKKEVGYICLNFKSSKLARYLEIDDPVVALDDILPQLRTGSLTSQQLHGSWHAMDRFPNLHILLGNRQREMSEFYSEKEIEVLVSIAKETVDYLIIDASSYWDNAGTLYSLLHADHIVVVTTNALSHFQEDSRKWFGQIGSSIGLDQSKCRALIVQQIIYDGAFTTKEVEKEMQIPVIGTVQFPLSLYRSLDEGKFEEWLQFTLEGQRFMLQPWKRMINFYGIKTLDDSRNRFNRLQAIFNKKIGEQIL